MFSRNHITLIGNVGQEPKSGASSSGSLFVSFSIATTDRWRDSAGDPQSHTEWHQVVCWGPLAYAAALLRKGSYVSVEGTLRSRKFVDKDGVERRAWEVKATRVGFLERMDLDAGESSGAHAFVSSAVDEEAAA